MTWDVLAAVPAAIVARAAGVRLAAFDVDGTLTDGRLCYGEDGREFKSFHVHDGHGLKLLRAHAIEVAIISARVSHTVSLRADELGIVHVYQGQRDKRACLLDLASALGLQPAQCAMTGDDIADRGALEACGLALAVADAHPALAAVAHWQTRRGGGHGAVREVCDLLLAAQGHLDAVAGRTP